MLSGEKSKAKFFTIIDANSKIPEDFFANIDEAINDKLLKFLLILPIAENKHCLTVDVKAYKVYKKNALCDIRELVPEDLREKYKDSGELRYIEDKIKFFAEENNNQNLIKEYNCIL